MKTVRIKADLNFEKQEKPTLDIEAVISQMKTQAGEAVVDDLISLLECEIRDILTHFTRQKKSYNDGYKVGFHAGLAENQEPFDLEAVMDLIRPLIFDIQKTGPAGQCLQDIRTILTTALSKTNQDKE